MDVRLIRDPPAAGTVNMAVDEALLEAAGRGETILRFYSWVPATLSLGYFQNYEDRHRHEASRDLAVVRRSTGGGAIVHDRDLTYSFVTPIARRFSADHQRLVPVFHETLIESLACWRIAVRLYGSAPPPNHPPPPHRPSKDRFLCFQRRGGDDVVMGGDSDGAKIAGSAQRRRRHALLQHGSVLLERSNNAPELPGIGDLVAHPPRLEALIDAWADRLAARLDVNLIRAELTDAERRSAENHRSEKYGTERWEKRR